MTEPAAADLPIRTDAGALDAAAGDFGGLIRCRPAAALKATTAGQVSAAVNLAVERGWGIGVQGRRHSTGGQAQISGGLALSTAGLDHLSVDERTRQADVGAGVRWDILVRHTLKHGLIPPVLTDYLGLSVGGTLSAGGFGGSSFHAGGQTDNVDELTVVTGTGEVVTCSARRNQHLFDASRAGFGQFGVIVAARLPLVPASPVVRTCKALYTDLHQMIEDQRILTAATGVISVQGFAVPNEPERLARTFGPDARLHLPSPDDRPWIYQIKVAHPVGDRWTPTATCDPLSGLSVPPGQWVAKECDALEFADRMAPDVRLMSEAGLWQASHPYLSVFLPAGRSADVISAALDTRSPADQRHGPVIIQVLTRRALRTPNMLLPAGDQPVLFSLLPNAYPSTPARVAALLNDNRRIHHLACRAGGTLYPFGSPPTDLERPRHHVLRTPHQRDMKRLFDPHGLFGR
ncbi:FAD-binding protein [Streptosporangium sp. NPDC001681]|uniref:FAD-binding protein n=1 Tax=Streptosporangium sp. NPDC001681 TaxID=3154395 RepID=UPI003330718F